MPLNLIEEDEFTAIITVPEDGDDRNAASIVPAFQGLTNRTRNARTRLDALTDELAALLTDDQTWQGVHTFEQPIKVGPGARVEATTYRRHKKLYPLTALDRQGGAAVVAEDLYCYTGAVTAKAWLNDIVPHGASIVGVRAQIRSTASAGTAMVMSLLRLTHNMAGDGGPNIVGASLNIASPGSGDHILSTGGLLSAVVEDTSTMVLTFVTNAAATFADPDRIRWIEVEYEGYFPTPYL